MVRGRRTRTTDTMMKDTSKGQLKLSPIITKRTPKSTTSTTHLTNTSAVNYEKSLEISRRTRNVRNRLQQIQKQFDNHAITKFFQRTLKSSRSIDLDVAMDDENACDGFNGAGGSRGSSPDQSDDAMPDTDYVAGNQCQPNDAIDLSGAYDCGGNGPSTNDYRHSIQSENIFLQKPVLRLDIDGQSLNHVATMVINKPTQSFAAATPFNEVRPMSMHAELASVFGTVMPSHALAIDRHGTASNMATGAESDGPALAASQYDQLQPSDHSDLNGSDRSDVSDGSSEKTPSTAERSRKPRKCGKRRSDSGFSDALNNSDSNSCDSGVVSDKSTESGSGDQSKPTTPHRIVCTSTVPTNAKEVRPRKLSQTTCSGNVAKRTRGRSIRNCQKPSAKAFFMSLKRSADLEPKPTIPPVPPVDITADVKIEDDSKSLEVADAPDANKMTVNVTVNKERPRPTTPFQTKQMTDYFPVRRSIRKTKKAVEQEYLRHIEMAIEKQNEDSLVVKAFKGKGRGICAGRAFSRSEFVVEYIGDLIDQCEADRREQIYAKDSALGCYMYYFKHKEVQWCIDATAETGKLGRLVNHSRNGNLVTKIVTYKNRPHLVLIAKEDIAEGEELTYDYGDRTRESLINHPWLAL